jgi:hypothetical protein
MDSPRPREVETRLWPMLPKLSSGHYACLINSLDLGSRSISMALLGRLSTPSSRSLHHCVASGSVSPMPTVLRRESAKSDEWPCHHGLEQVHYESEPTKETRKGAC